MHYTIHSTLNYIFQFNTVIGLDTFSVRPERVPILATSTFCARLVPKDSAAALQSVSCLTLQPPALRSINGFVYNIQFAFKRLYICPCLGRKQGVISSRLSSSRIGRILLVDITVSLTGPDLLGF